MPIGISSCTLCELFCQVAFCCEDMCVFSVHFCDVMLVLFCDCTDLLKWLMWRSNGICIKFCFKLSRMASETHRMLKEAFGDNAIGQMQTYEWVKCFKNRRMSIDDEERFGWCLTVTTTENVAKVREAILEDRWQMIHNVCNIVRLSCGMCQKICQMSLTWGALQQNLCQGCWAVIKRSTTFLSALS